MELTNIENWRSINLNLNYEVSDIGRVKTVKTGLIRKPALSRGYYTVSLYIDGKEKIIKSIDSSLKHLFQISKTNLLSIIAMETKQIIAFQI